MIQPEARLFLVYNADSGLLNAVRDSFWKTFRPSTYPCALCALAFGFFMMHRRWRRFLERVPLEKVELHRNDFHRELPGLEQRLPAIVLARSDGSRALIASANEMEAMGNLDELIALSARRLGEQGVMLDTPQLAELG